MRTDHFFDDRVLVIAVTGLTLLSVLQLTKSVIRREMGNQLLTLVTTTALMIDAEQHTALTSLGDSQNPIYRDIKGTILRQLHANPQTHVKYLYTMVHGNRPGIYRFVVDSDETASARMGEEYDANLHPGMLDAFNGWQLWRSRSSKARDKWGGTQSAYAPIRDRSGIPVAIVESRRDGGRPGCNAPGSRVGPDPQSGCRVVARLRCRHLQRTRTCTPPGRGLVWTIAA